MPTTSGTKADNATLTSDIYRISEYVNEVKKNNTEGVSEDTLQLGIFGYLGEMFSNTIQNSIIMASEFSNESIPTKAKFEKNVIAHALGMGITDINAVPAQMDVLLTFLEEDIINWANAKNNNGDELPWEFTFDRDNAIYFGDYEFHTDYDIRIKKILVNTSGTERKFAYTASYIIDIDNPVSDITNPYLTPPVKMNINGTKVVFMKCTIRQVEKKEIYRKLLSDNSISNKTITFEFSGQLAAFTIDVVEGTTTTHMVPVYEGLSVETQKYPYFYYTYLDANTIRIKFDRYSYAPRINADITINLQTTQGDDGNFVYNSTRYPGFIFESERLGYDNITCEVRPVTGEALYGSDKKTVEDLKKIIPKEALSRGSITNLADLQNYFNMLDTESSKLYFYKKRDNALERLYYSFIVLKNSRDIIIPTNTIDIKIYPNQMQTEEGTTKLLLPKGTYFVLDDEGKGVVFNPEDTDKTYNDYFKYVIPYNFIINTQPLYGMYTLNVIDTNKMLDFTYINEQCFYQYIATSIHWGRPYIVDSDTYTLTISIEQNISDDVVMVEVDPDTGDITSKVDVYMVFYNEEDSPLRWAKAEIVAFDVTSNILTFNFTFTTQDYIDNDNRIRIDTGLYDIGTNTESYAHLWSNTKAILHIVSEQDAAYGLNHLDDIIPGLDGKSLSNSYTILDGLDFFYDYSDIVNSIVTTENIEGTNTSSYTVRAVPMVKYDYFTSEDRVNELCSELVNRKVYIDNAVTILEDAFGMDFKFFNTYGPSKLFTLDNELDYINRVNMSLTFRLKLRPNYDSSVMDYILADIKTYIEDIDDIRSLHMPNLITQITSTYQEFIVFFEFVDMNGYGPGVQHIYSMDMPDEIVVPEFLNINTLSDETPDINIIMD